MLSRRLAFLVLLAVTIGGAGSGTPEARAQTLNDTRVKVDVLVQGLNQPIAMTYIGFVGEFLVTQKGDGKVLYFAPGATTGQVILDVAVNAAEDRGLLGIAADPGWAFSTSQYVYLYFSESSTGADTTDPASVLGNRIYRYRFDPSTPVKLVDPLLILDLPATPVAHHLGGVLRFGPDDMLYAVIGDLDRDGKLENNPAGADPDDTGAVLRIDTLGRPAPGNPFADAGSGGTAGFAMSRVYAYGVRSSFGLAFDPVGRRLWDSENGPDAYDEVNLVAPGFNSGWKPIMGPDARDPQGPGDLWVAPGSTYRDPDFSWAVPVSPTALTFVLSRKLGCGTQHDLLAGDYGCGNLYRFQPNTARDGLVFTSAGLLDHVADNSGLVCSNEMGEILYGTGFGVVTDMVTDPGGLVALVSWNHGRIYRLSPNTGAFADADNDSVDDVCDCAPGDRFAVALPSEVPFIRLARPYPSPNGNTAIGWDLQNLSAGSGTRSDLVSGDLAALRYSNDYSRACSLGTTLLLPPLVDTRPDPPPGFGYYYLARARNNCGAGTFGDGNLGSAGGGAVDPRDALDAASSWPVCGLCAGRAGGAIITFGFMPSPETMRVWVTNDAFIDQAKQFLAAGSTTMVPVFYTLRDGKDCDPVWTWHSDPVDVAWATATIELCDGLPSGVEADKDYWFQIGFCPWSAEVIAVDDQR